MLKKDLENLLKKQKDHIYNLTKKYDKLASDHENLRREYIEMTKKMIEKRRWTITDRGVDEVKYEINEIKLNYKPMESDL